MEKVRVEALKDFRAAPDGFTTFYFEAGQVYEVDVDLAEPLLRDKLVKKVPDGKMLKGAPENKMAKGAPENK